ncbi:nucleoside deaminase [Methanosalsum natronophilum]|uniref:Nucleoside deaminase n=1 Tax=Methanosalsum natronophilum TaxID=768733 RepID=A0A3R8CDJ4_9EURY|nr:nucleoside deaminase [Methanosalsum natronophilum]MCS3923837.1 cytosine deaminase [Methanosalsum natronophilum]RQD89117.1 MAG: nucleoside deaminase [Methanosalsum natronophilum]
MDKFMEAALEEAQKGLNEGGIPIGSALVKNGKVVGKGHNMRIQENDPMAHAEIVCLRDAGRIETYGDTILYSTLMPCYLCAGAAVQFGIKKVIVGEAENFTGALEFMEEHDIEVINLNDSKCKGIMQKFIQENKEIWFEDIGKE